jgi:hypothetical protein
MSDILKENWETILQKIIKPMYVDGEFPLTLADEVVRILENQLIKGWIPVSKRMPDGAGKYRVTVKYQNFSGLYLMVADAEFIEGIWKILGEQPLIYNRAITAWQPIPEPYKEEDD